MNDDQQLSQQQWQCEQEKRDLFSLMLNENDTPLTEGPTFFNEICEEKHVDQETNGFEKVDAFSEPAYVKKVEPSLPLSIVKATAMLTELYKSPMKAHSQAEIQGKVATLMIQTRAYEKTPSLTQDDGQDDEQMNKCHKKRKEKEGKKEGKKEPYPTKNFLPSFRSSFINYLKPNFTEDQFYRFQVIKRIKGKPCINLKDYQDLFKVKEFRPILAVYFDNQVIVRDLMMSRIDYEVKREYLKRINVFQEAFESGVFKKIN